MSLHRFWDSYGLVERMKKISMQANRSGMVFQHEDSTGPSTVNPRWSQDYQAYIEALLKSDVYSKQVRSWMICPSTSVRSKYGCPEVWSREIHHLNCEYVWKGVEKNVELSGTYWDALEDDLVIEGLVMRASVRLAGVLNAIFADRE